MPLALGPEGARLAKRDGAVTLADLVEVGVDVGAVRSQLVTSLGLSVPGEKLSPRQLLDRFEIDRLPRQPWVPDQAQS